MMNADADSVYIRCKSDITWRLIGEFSQWYGRLGTMGEIPRAFAGVTSAHQQVIVILSGLPFDDVERREFVIWLCREEQVDAYVYGTHVMSAKSGETPTELLALYASSHRFNINASFAP